MWTSACVTATSTLQHERFSKTVTEGLNLSAVSRSRGEALHSGTESHGGFSPTAVQIRDDLSQALCEASWSGRADEGVLMREGAGEVTLL